MPTVVRGANSGPLEVFEYNDDMLGPVTEICGGGDLAHATAKFIEEEGGQLPRDYSNYRGERFHTTKESRDGKRTGASAETVAPVKTQRDTVKRDAMRKRAAGEERFLASLGPALEGLSWLTKKHLAWQPAGEPLANALTSSSAEVARSDLRGNVPPAASVVVSLPSEAPVSALMFPAELSDGTPSPVNFLGEVGPLFSTCSRLFFPDVGGKFEEYVRSSVAAKFGDNRRVECYASLDAGLMGGDWRLLELLRDAGHLPKRVCLVDAMYQVRHGDAPPPCAGAWKAAARQLSQWLSFVSDGNTELWLFKSLEDYVSLVGRDQSFASDLLVQADCPRGPKGTDEQEAAKVKQILKPSGLWLGLDRQGSSPLRADAGEAQPDGDLKMQTTLLQTGVAAVWWGWQEREGALSCMGSQVLRPRALVGAGAGQRLGDMARDAGVSLKVADPSGLREAMLTTLRTQG